MNQVECLSYRAVELIPRFNDKYSIARGEQQFFPEPALLVDENLPTIERQVGNSLCNALYHNRRIFYGSAVMGRGYFDGRTLNKSSSLDASVKKER